MAVKRHDHWQLLINSKGGQIFFLPEWPGIGWACIWRNLLPVGRILKKLEVKRELKGRGKRNMI
jgi:hypothetical protein